MNKLPTHTTQGFAGYWCGPGETERLALKAVQDCSPEFGYFGFPWFSLIHAIETNNLRALRELLSVASSFRGLFSGGPLVTVTCHPMALKYIHYFQDFGISHLCFSHKESHQDAVEGIRILPFPMVPFAGSGLPTLDESRVRPHLVNFVGTEVNGDECIALRKYIFTLKSAADLKIIERPHWHYLNSVERDLDWTTNDCFEHKVEEIEFENQLKNAMRDSCFTLCPGGRGPVSARIYEALSFGSIPIIPNDKLDLPGDTALWQDACIITTDSSEGVDLGIEIARRCTDEEMQAMRSRGKELLATLTIQAYMQKLRVTAT